MAAVWWRWSSGKGWHWCGLGGTREPELVHGACHACVSTAAFLDPLDHDVVELCLWKALVCEVLVVDRTVGRVGHQRYSLQFLDRGDPGVGAQERAYVDEPLYVQP